MKLGADIQFLFVAQYENIHVYAIYLNGEFVKLLELDEDEEVPE